MSCFYVINIKKVKNKSKCLNTEKGAGGKKSGKSGSQQTISSGHRVY